MKTRNHIVPLLSAVVAAILACPARADTQAELDAALKKIDPKVVRPRYPRQGKMMVRAGLPHGFPAKATITFTTTDGKHTATCEVGVTN